MTSSQRTPVLVLFLLIALQFFITSAYGLTRYFELKASGYDSGVFMQLLYNALHGDGLVFSIGWPNSQLPIGRNMVHYFSLHFSPVIYLLAPFFYFCQSFATLQLIHTALLALAAWPIYLCAKRLLDAPWQALIVAFLYLLNPYVVNAGIWDFHEIAFAPFCVAWLVYALITHNKWFFGVCCVFLLLVKEHYGISVFGAGLLWAWHWKECKFGAAIATLGFAALLCILFIIMPHFSPAGIITMMDSSSKIDRFSWVFDPLGHTKLFGIILASAFFYAAMLFFPFWFLPLRVLLWLFPAGADLAANALAANDMMRDTFSYHNATVIPVVLVAFAVALKKYYANEGKLKRIDILVGSAAFSAFLFYTQTALPLNQESNVWEFSAPRLGYTQADADTLAHIEKTIGQDAALSAQNNILAHLPVRKKMYHFPETIGDAEYIVLHTGFPFERQYQVFGAPYSAPGTQYFKAAWKLLDSPDWGIVLYDHDWLVFKKDAATDTTALHAAKRALSKSQDHYMTLLKRDTMTYQLLMEQPQSAGDSPF